MIAALFTKLLGFVTPNKWIILVVVGLLFTTSASAYMLKQSYVKLGQQEVATNLWMVSSGKWKQTFTELDEKLLQRERERNKAWVKLAELKKQIEDLKDDENGCLDRTIPADVRLLLKSSSTD